MVNEDWRAYRSFFDSTGCGAGGDGETRVACRSSRTDIMIYATSTTFAVTMAVTAASVVLPEVKLC